MVEKELGDAKDESKIVSKVTKKYQRVAEEVEYDDTMSEKIVEPMSELNGENDEK